VLRAGLGEGFGEEAAQQYRHPASQQRQQQAVAEAVRMAKRHHRHMPLAGCRRNGSGNVRNPGQQIRVRARHQLRPPGGSRGTQNRPGVGGRPIVPQPVRYPRRGRVGDHHAGAVASGAAGRQSSQRLDGQHLRKPQSAVEAGKLQSSQPRIQRHDRPAGCPNGQRPGCELRTVGQQETDPAVVPATIPGFFE
jgi:hypothetical protein